MTRAPSRIRLKDHPDALRLICDIWTDLVVVIILVCRSHRLMKNCLAFFLGLVLRIQGWRADSIAK